MTTVSEGIYSLSSALDIGGQYLPDSLRTEAGELRDSAAGRQKVGEDVTVVALAGATGSGKSSLINSLVGEDIARVAATRPTTSEPLAIASAESSEILDWLGIDRRHISGQLASRFGLSAADGKLVLVDLPDIDSTQAGHRQIASRLTQRVDVVVWVLDPQKYADAVVHEDFLTSLGEHAEVTIVVLNQVDRLDGDALSGVVSDANRLLEADGLDAQVLPTSAHTGVGVDELRQRIATFVREQKASRQKLAADLRSLGTELAEQAGLGSTTTDLTTRRDFTPVARSIGRAAGVDTVAKAAGESYLVRGKKATGWPLTRWIRGKVDPMKKLHLDRETQNPDLAPATGLAVSSSALTSARGELRRYVEAETASMPRAWAHDVQDTMAAQTNSMLGDVDRILSGTNLERGRHPKWWTAVNILQWILVIVALIGGLWLLLLGVADWLQLALPDPPTVSIFPVPTVMLILGLLLGWILTIIARAALGTGAKRTEKRVSDRLTKEIATRATQTILEPLEDAKSKFATYSQHVTELTSVRA